MLYHMAETYVYPGNALGQLPAYLRSENPYVVLKLTEQELIFSRLVQFDQLHILCCVLVCHGLDDPSEGCV